MQERSEFIQMVSASKEGSDERVSGLLDEVEELKSVFLLFFMRLRLFSLCCCIFKCNLNSLGKC